ncbi:glycosyltransferase [Kiritimatiellaeota bacterium B1221]|nr:glycosyltransferase [Kiritimatiellaeota bacterium B1221]
MSERVLLSVGSFHPAHGGPYFSVGHLAEALQASGVGVQMVAGDYPHLPIQPAPEGVELKALPAKLWPLLRQSRVPGCADKLDQWISEFKPTVLHDNGLWLSLNHQISKASSRHKLPFILSPRGCLDPWALKYRRWKKSAALALYQRNDLVRVSCFHATSELEMESIRKAGLRQPVAIIPNGIELSSAVEKITGKLDKGCGENPDSDFRALTSLPQSGKRYALFMGRLHPVKNLPALLRVWAVVRPVDWVLRLVGSDEVGHQAELEALAEELGISEQVEFLGPKYGTEKAALFRTSELAFLVSHSENFGLFAAEALGYGLPVIASKTTPWRCLETEGLGWWVECNHEGITRGLRQFLDLDSETYCLLSEKARVYAKSLFGWGAISEKFTSLYEWVSGKGEKPDFIHEE